MASEIITDNLTDEDRRDVAERFQDLTERERQIIVAMRPILGMTDEEERRLAKSISAAVAADDRATFRALLTEAERLPLDEVIDYLGRSEYEVRHNLTRHADEYTVSHSWTEKGLRHSYARLKLAANLEYGDG